LEVGEGQKQRFGAVSEPAQNERNKIAVFVASKAEFTISQNRA